MIDEKDDLNASAGGNGDNLNAEKGVTADTAEAEKTVAAAGLGKFKSVEALAAAYLSLEAEFTRRNKRLKELEERNKAQATPEAAPSLGSATDKDQLLKAALEDEGVRTAVIGEYVKAVQNAKSVPLIIGGVGSAAPKAAVKSVKEAGALAERFLKG